jgi:hypothetical protein
MKKVILFQVLIIALVSSTFSQTKSSDSSMSIPMMYANYAYHFPGGDLADWYGNSSMIGGGFQWKDFSNWVYGVEYSYLFGSKIKILPDIMGNLTTSDGNIIDQAGNYAAYSTYERGFYLSGKIGKILPILNPNPNSGFFISASFGYFQHKIRLEVTNNNVPQLNGDYKKGYDRLVGGFGISQFVGYMYVSDKRLVNFFAGFEFLQSWTKPKRDVYFDTQQPDPLQKRFDMLSGFKVGWIIPLNRRAPEKYYYF